MALPRQGHLDILYHMFAFLKIKHNAEMVLDPSEVMINDEMFPREDWTKCPYGTSVHEVPNDAHDQLG